MQGPQIHSFACGILSVLASVGGGDVRERRISSVGRRQTRLAASIEYQDRSRLEVNLILDVSQGFVDVWSYSFHYMNSEFDTIFRYDDADHHPELPGFPHHKHEGSSETAVNSVQPSARAIRNEIEVYIRDNG